MGGLPDGPMPAGPPLMSAAAVHNSLRRAGSPGARCTAVHPDEESRCMLDELHRGLHEDVGGRTWP